MKLARTQHIWRCTELKDNRIKVAEKVAKWETKLIEDAKLKEDVKALKEKDKVN